MKNIVGLVFLIPISFVAFAAERPEKSPFVTRGKPLGDTGALPASDTPRPQRANSLQRAQTIRVNLPRKTSNGEGEKRAFYKSPRSQDDFIATRDIPVDLSKFPSQNK